MQLNQQQLKKTKQMEKQKIREIEKTQFENKIQQLTK